jgi:hypothetical protein
MGNVNLTGGISKTSGRYGWLDLFSKVLIPKSGQLSGFELLHTPLSGYTPRRDL